MKFIECDGVHVNILEIIAIFSAEHHGRGGSRIKMTDGSVFTDSNRSPQMF